MRDWLAIGVLALATTTLSLSGVLAGARLGDERIINGNQQRNTSHQRQTYFVDISYFLSKAGNFNLEQQ